MPTSPDHFPFQFSDLADLRAYERIRPEGTDPSQYWYQFWRGLTYLKKYYSKRERAAPAMAEHFEIQRAVLGDIRALESRASTTLGVVGDLMWIRDGWETFLSQEARQILSSVDALFGNLETVVSPNLPVNEWLPDIVRYNSPPSYLRAFQDGAGGHLFDALSTANNHTLDFGDRGALETTAVLDEMGIPHSGVRERADARRWVEAQAGEFRVGFVAATFGVNYPDDLAQSRIALSRVPGLAPEGDALPDLGELEEDLRDMDAAEIDFRVVSIHWGFEYECYPTARMMQTARRLVQAGADLVMGHHPHLQHPLEMLWVNQTSGVDDPAAARHLALTSELEDPRGPPRRGLVAYSLGNFTTTMVTHACKLAVLLSVSLERDAVSGRARLRAPHTRWFYNIAPFAGRGAKTRRLVPVEALERAHPAIAAAKKMKHHVDGTEP